MTTEPGDAARAHRRRRRRRATARHALARTRSSRRRFASADAHRGGRRDRRHGGLRRRRAELRPGRRAPERDATRAMRAGGQAGHGVRAGRQRLAGQDDRRRQDVDARQRRDLRGRARRRLPDGARRATRWTRPAACSARNDGGATWKTLDTGTTARPFAARRADARRPSSSPAPPACAARPTAATRSRPSRDRDVVKAKLDGDRPRGQRARSPRGARDLLRSTDRGKTWTAIHKPTVNRKPARLIQVDFLDAKNGLLPGRGRRAVAHAPTPARRGPRCPASAPTTAYGMAFSSKTEGLPGHRPLRRRDEPLGLPAASTTDGGAHVAPAVRGLHADPGAGIAAAPGGDRLPARRRSRASCSRTTGGEAGKASTLSVTTKRKKLSKPAGITVTGQLSPAAGNERVTVSYLPPGSGRWQHQTVKTAANGSYTTSWRVRQGQQPLRGPVGGRLPLQGRRLGRADREGRQVARAHAARAGSATRARPWPHAAPSASRAWGRWSASGGSAAR